MPPGRVAAIAAMVAAVGVAAYCDFAWCRGSVARAAIIGTALIIPAFVFLLAKYYWGAVLACVAMAIPAVWAYRVECVLPYAGGGAPMAFIWVVFLGLPAALIFGGIVGRVLKDWHAS
jgi:hypothetical protein